MILSLFHFTEAARKRYSRWTLISNQVFIRNKNLLLFKHYCAITLMFHFLHDNASRIRYSLWQCLFLLVIVSFTDSQHVFVATFAQSTPGTRYQPIIESAQLISTILANTVKKCMMSCTSNVLCRIYDYEVFEAKKCRLFEGDTTALGQIVSSSSPQSVAGVIRLSTNLFTEYGSPCSSFCYHSRYLQCGSNSTCECTPHMYWDATISMCVPQSPILGASCQQNKSMCREDLNYTCLQFNQCGRKFQTSRQSFHTTSSEHRTICAYSIQKS